MRPFLLSLLVLAPALTLRGQDLGFQAAKILSANCTGCHGAALKNSGLDLRTRDGLLKGGERGPALVPGSPETSRLFQFVSHAAQPSMPPGRKLPDADIQTLRLWIAKGAPYEGVLDQKEEEARAALAKLEERPITDAERRWWAFQKPVRKPAPEVANSAWPRNDVDRFLLAALEKKGLKPSPEADRRTLVRRAYLDVLGLLPTPAQTAEFVNDSRPDAWERLVDKLLASPHYGERWARHWLDLVRYSDSGGFEYDRERLNAYRYRDYVVNAFNADKPYDRFLKEQIAGDELFPNSPEAWIATSFLRLGVENNIKTEQTRMDELDDIVVTTSNAFLGLTVGCARCHNHKFDPIPQKDYYAIQAVFFPTRSWERPLVGDAEQAAHRAEVKKIDALQAPIRKQIREVEQPFRDAIIARRKAALPEYMLAALNTPEDKRTEGQKLNVIQVNKSLDNIRDEDLEAEMSLPARARRDLLLAQVRDLERQKPELPTAMSIREDGPTPRPSYFLHRGNLGQKGSQMAPGVLSVATHGEYKYPAPPPDAKSSHRRRGFAEWLASPDNPLTARVFVNRIWQHHFGEGIVRTPSNFGRMGERPTHPELLDWLATEFTSNGWSMKHMHKLLLTSSAYRMASDDIPANVEADKDNRLLWRMPRRRLEGEAIRDLILAAAGTLDTRIGGPAMYPYIDPLLFQASSKRTWHGSPVNDVSTYRRSLYIFSKRSIPLPMLEVFDKPDTITSCGRRNSSTIAPQALVLMNNEFVNIQARHFAQRLEMEADPDTAAQVRRGYEIALSRPPTAQEVQLARNLIESYPQGLADFAHALFNLNEFVYIQ
jgi:mono/diheme cytochrome c family protein